MSRLFLIFIIIVIQILPSSKSLRLKKINGGFCFAIYF